MQASDITAHPRGKLVYALNPWTHFGTLRNSSGRRRTPRETAVIIVHPLLGFSKKKVHIFHFFFKNGAVTRVSVSKTWFFRENSKKKVMIFMFFLSFFNDFGMFFLRLF